MTETLTLHKVYRELRQLRDDVAALKQSVFDPDTIMTPEEQRRYEESKQRLAAGKTTSLAELERELGV